MKHVILLALFCLIAGSVNAQVEIFVSGNANLYVPENTATKGMYPILGYKKEADPHVLVGGFGVGAAAEKKTEGKIKYKAELTLSRHAYWESLKLVDQSNMYLGDLVYSTVDYTVHVLPSIHYPLHQKLFIGAGFGCMIILESMSRVPNHDATDDSKLSVRNKFYKTFNPVIPVELSYRTEKKLYSIRFEQSLGSRYKNTLKELDPEHFGIISFSVGWKVR